MKNYLLPVSILALCLTSGIASAKANIDACRPGAQQETFRFTPKIDAPQMLDSEIFATTGVTKKAFAPEAKKSLPEGDAMGWLKAPNGETWSYVGQFTHDNKVGVSHYCFTIYDAQFNELTKVEDDVAPAENETRIVDVSLGAVVTKKFFNTDDKPEFMVMVAANTPQYVNHYYTRIYSQGIAEPLTTIEGYLGTYVNTASDSWNENYYIGFMTTQDTTTPKVGEVDNKKDYVIDFYKKAGYNTPISSVLSIRIPTILSSGEAWVPLVATTHNGKAYIAANYLKYSFYEEPTNYNNENLTKDNEFIIDYYEIPSRGTASIIHRTAVPMTGSATDINLYYLGYLLADGDVTYGRYTEDDSAPAFTVTRAHYEVAGDEYSYSFYVYPAGTQEQPHTDRILTLGENIYAMVPMSDLRGYDPQIAFVKRTDTDFTFDFVNLVSGKVECTMPYRISENIALNADVDRVAGKDTPLYVVAPFTLLGDEEGNVIQEVVYIKPDGTIDHIDQLNLGKDAVYASVFISASALDPYVFNTNPEREYMVMTKRLTGTGNGNGYTEELSVISPTKGALFTVNSKDELGNIVSGGLITQSEYGQSLHVIYRTPDFRYNTEIYKLPFVKFAGGDGSEANPYQIATIGDLRQVKFEPTAHYVLVNDIDARNAEMEYVTADFKGVFDGADHSIIGPELCNHGIFYRLVGNADDGGGEVKNLKIIEPTVVIDKDHTSAGILADAAATGKISNVLVYDAKASNEVQDAISITFGGLVGKSSLYTQIAGSGIIGADFNLPGASVGGIVGETATSSAVKACSFKGTIVGGKGVGGIVGESSKSDDSVVDCHVNASITGENTVGGIAGGWSRGVLTRSHVQGEIKATTPSKWGGGVAAGGLIGKLSTDWEMANKPDGEYTPVIKGNFINITSLEGATSEKEEKFEGENDTCHRVVGASCANEEPTAIYDENWNVIGYEDAIVEKILADNYVISTLSRVNESIADDGTTTEGKSIASGDLGKEFFKNLGYAYGSNIDSPWNENTPASPTLFFENVLVSFGQSVYEGEKGSQIDMNITIYGDKVDGDDVNSIIIDIADESVIEKVGLDYADGQITLSVKALKEGETTVKASYNGVSATATVTVKEQSGIMTVQVEDISIRINGLTVEADGCIIDVYGVSGMKVLSGVGRCDLRDLEKGIYVVSASDRNGRRSVLKIAR